MDPFLFLASIDVGELIRGYVNRACQVTMVCTARIEVKIIKEAEALIPIDRNNIFVFCIASS